MTMASEVLQKLSDPSLLVTAGLVSGQWRAPEGKTFQVYEPSSGTVLRDCANLGRQDFLDAIDSAEVGTQKFHQEKTAKERGAILRKWFDLVTANTSDCTSFSSKGMQARGPANFQRFTVADVWERPRQKNVLILLD